MNWYYRSKEITELPQSIAYFIYLIEYEDDTLYVGSKSVWTQRRLKPLKDMRKNAKRLKLVESKWKSYVGSSKNTADKKIKSKTILHLCSNKRTATYLEAKEILCRSALESDMYLNQNCLGKFYENCLDGLVKEYGYECSKI